MQSRFFWIGAAAICMVEALGLTCADSITQYWVTNTATSDACLYGENNARSSLPTAIIVVR